MATSATNYDDHEKSRSIHDENTRGAPLRNAVSIQLSNEQYERLFFQPGGPAHVGDLSKRFGNPTGLAIIGFLLALTPTACCLMGWRGATAASLATIIGSFYFLGGLAMVIAGVLEWVLGNTFPFIVFVSFGGFWLSLGSLNDPSKMITSAFSQGAAELDYNSALEFYFIFWAITCFVFFCASLRTNIVFAEIFFTLVFTFAFLAAGYDNIGHGHATLAARYIKAAGAFAFATCMGGWYLAFVLIFASVDMPFVLPVGDLSNLLKRKNQ